MPSDLGRLNRPARSPRLRALLALGLGLLLVGAACQPPTFEDEDESIFPERKELELFEEGDIEKNLGEKVEDMVGWDAAVLAADFVQQLTETEKEGYLVLNIAVVNQAGRERRYRRFDWKVVTPKGEELNHTFVQGVDEQLPNNEQLEEGEAAQGLVIFRVRDEKGTFWVHFQPSGVDDERGIWKVEVPG